MFTTPSRARDARSSTPLAGAARSGNRPSRAGTPVFGSHDPISPPSFLSPSTFRRDDNTQNDAGDVSATSLFLNGARTRTSRARPRPSSMLAASAGPSASLLSPSDAFDREGSVISEDADMRSVADTVHSASHAGYNRRSAPAPKDAKTQLDEGPCSSATSGSTFRPTRACPPRCSNCWPRRICTSMLSKATSTSTPDMLACFRAPSASCGTTPAAASAPARPPALSSPCLSTLPQACRRSTTCRTHASCRAAGAEREPALLLVTPDGQTCLWEGISSSLTRQDRAQRIAAPLSSGEAIVKLQRIDESTVVLATSASRLLRVSVGSRAGILQAEVRPFSNRAVCSVASLARAPPWARPTTTSRASP